MARQGSPDLWESNVPDMPEDTVATERWLPVVDFEGYYEVSDHGRVRSVSRVIPILGGSPRRLRGRLMAPTLGAYGYPTISLWRNNKGILVKVHKLVLESIRANETRRRRLQAP